ncbi:MAG: hypothetical protein IKR48_04350 [Kiritimatiellae bacterium]|nr:hypothetical protein [Kiritimatiellia bacterium]
MDHGLVYNFEPPEVAVTSEEMRQSPEVANEKVKSPLCGLKLTVRSIERAKPNFKQSKTAI